MIVAAASITDWIALVTAIGAAIASCIAAWRSTAVHQAIKPPSNGTSIGALAENTNVLQRIQTHLLNDMAGSLDSRTNNRREIANLPTPAQTAQGVPGATLADPPPPLPPPAPPS